MTDEAKFNGRMQNAVRQVLMNEMGFTRDTVRAEMHKIVEETVARAINRMLHEGLIERHVQREFERYIRENQWDTSAVRKLVVAAAEKCMREYIASRVDFTIALKPPGPDTDGHFINCASFDGRPCDCGFDTRARA